MWPANKMYGVGYSFELDLFAGYEAPVFYNFNVNNQIIFNPELFLEAASRS